jgi:hypothetical protein
MRSRSLTSRASPIWAVADLWLRVGDGLLRRAALTDYRLRFLRRHIRRWQVGANDRCQALRLDLDDQSDDVTLDLGLHPAQSFSWVVPTIAPCTR